MPRFVCRLFVALVAGLAALGCGGDAGPVPVRVRGVVRLDGQPVANAAVVFVAQAPGGRDAYGSTDAAGVFTLTTFRPGDGALPGTYKVVIQPAGEGGGSTPFDDTDKSPRPAKPKAPARAASRARYSAAGQTPLTQGVPADGEVVFDLRSK